MPRALLLAAAFALAAAPQPGSAQDRDARGRLRGDPWAGSTTTEIPEPIAPPMAEPVPLLPPGGDPVEASRLVNAGRVQGFAWTDQASWPFLVTIAAADPATGFLTGEMEWQNEGALHRIEGWAAPDTLSFTEVEAIVPGDALLNCTYTLPLLTTDGQGVHGTWTCASGEAGWVYVMFPQ